MREEGRGAEGRERKEENVRKERTCPSAHVLTRLTNTHNRCTRPTTTTHTHLHTPHDSPNHKKVSCQIVEVMSDTEAILKCDITTKTSTSGGTVAYKVYPYVNQAAMFSSVFDRLNDGGAVGIFPEGGSHDRTQLLPLKAGAAMMALGAMAKYENLQVRTTAPCVCTVCLYRRLSGGTVCLYRVSVPCVCTVCLYRLSFSQTVSSKGVKGMKGPVHAQAVSL